MVYAGSKILDLLTSMAIVFLVFLNLSKSRPFRTADLTQTRRYS